MAAFRGVHRIIKGILYFFFLPRCSHTWERAPVSEHRADFTQFLNQDGR
jgi:hypothetical protein